MSARRVPVMDVWERLGLQPVRIDLGSADVPAALRAALPGIHGDDLEAALIEIEQVRQHLTDFVTLEWSMAETPLRHYRARLARGVYEDGDSIEGFAEDVSAEVTARRKAAARTEEMESLIAALPEAVLVVRRGRVVASNASARRMLGAGVRDSAPVLGLVPASERTRLAPHARSGGTPPPFTFSLDEDGGRWVEVVSSELSTREGTRVLTFRDVTDRRQAELRATAGDRLASVGRLAAGMAHEINNPLTYVMLNLEMLREDVEDFPSSGGRTRIDGLRQKLDDALTGANRVAEIIQQLRLYAHQREDASVSGSVSEAVLLATQLASFAVADSVSVEVDVPEDLRPVAMGVGQLSQVVLNLCVNGGDAMEEAGQVTGRIHISAAARDRGVVLSVRDDGPGIPDSLRESIFRPFFTTKEPGKGTGMGLSISRGLIHSCGGSLSLRDSEKGAWFEIFLPFAVDAAKVEDGPTVEVSLSGRRQLLVIDDEPALCRALAARMRNSFEVTIASDGQEAQSLIEGGFRPDAILCDIEMPRMDGPTFIEWLGEYEPELQGRVLVMTGGTLDPSRAARVEQTGRTVMSKPLDMSSLQGALVDIVSEPEPEPEPEAEKTETIRNVKRAAPIVDAAATAAPEPGLSAREEPSGAERRGAPRVRAKGIRALLDLGDEVHKAAVVDMSSTGFRIHNGVLPSELLKQPEVRVLLLNGADEPVSVGARFVWQREKDDASVEYGLAREPSVTPAPAVLTRWIEDSGEPLPVG